MALRAIWGLKRAAFVMAREGLFAFADNLNDIPAPIRACLTLARLLERRSARKKDYRTRLSHAMFRLGPSYVKLGQFLATRADLVGKALAKELAHLQDDLPPFAREEAVAEIVRQLGGNLEDHFLTLGEAVAAASIAQVHKGEILDEEGNPEPVAVKILRPGIAARFKRDLKSFYLAARLIEFIYPPARRLRPRAVVDTLARSVTLEMDFRLEAAALSETADNIQDDPYFDVPEVKWMHTSRTILTMGWVEGIKLTDVEALTEAGHDLPALACHIIQSFLRHAVRDGFFHADMHQGNLFVTAQGDIVAVDYGITGRLSEAERRFLAEILYGFITRNYHRVAEVHFEAGYVPADQDIDVFAQAIRAIGEPIQGHDASQISMARLLSQLLDVTDLFAMSTQTRLIMLQKTMVVVEGVARTLDPNLDMWRTAEPVMRGWIEDNLSPRAHMRKSSEAFGRFLTNLPKTLELLEKGLKQRESAQERDLAQYGSASAAEGKHGKSRTYRAHITTNLLLLTIALALSAIAIRLW